MIAVPSRGTVRIEFAASLVAQGMPSNFTRVLRVIPGLSVEEARNVAAREALEMDTEYLFFLDDDILAPNQTITRMVRILENEPEYDLVSAVYPLKSPEAEPAVYRDDRPGPYWGWTFNEVFEIDSCGMGACMIRTSALKKISEPWFAWVETADGKDSAEVGEDIYFCRKLKEAGGRLLADGGILCGHIDTDGTVYQMSADSAPIKRGRKALEKYKVIT